MVGHLNSDQDDGIILMMAGLPVSRLEALVDHCIKGMTGALKSKVAQVSARPGEAVTPIISMEHGRPLLIQDQHIAETRICDQTFFICSTVTFRYLYLKLAVT